MNNKKIQLKKKKGKSWMVSILTVGKQCVRWKMYTDLTFCIGSPYKLKLNIKIIELNKWIDWNLLFVGIILNIEYK